MDRLPIDALGLVLAYAAPKDHYRFSCVLRRVCRRFRFAIRRLRSVELAHMHYDHLASAIRCFEDCERLRVSCFFIDEPEPFVAALHRCTRLRSLDIECDDRLPQPVALVSGLIGWVEARAHRLEYFGLGTFTPICHGESIRGLTLPLLSALTGLRVPQWPLNTPSCRMPALRSLELSPAISDHNSSDLRLLSTLTDLECLSLRGNAGAYPVEDWLGLTTLTNLRRLVVHTKPWWFGSQHLPPSTWQAWWAAFRRLESIDLGIEPTAFFAVQPPPRLRRFVFDCGSNYYSPLPESFARWLEWAAPSLHALEIVYPRREILASVRALTNLRTLHVQFANSIGSFPGLWSEVLTLATIARLHLTVCQGLLLHSKQFIDYPVPDAVLDRRTVIRVHDRMFLCLRDFFAYSDRFGHCECEPDSRRP